MNKKDLIIIAFVFVIGVLSRIPFLEQMQSHWDGPQYSIAIIRYSLEQQTPAPPGYPLYIAMGRAAYFLTNDPHNAILFLNVLFSGLGAIVFYLIGKALFNRSVGIIATILFLSGTTFYFFGITAYPYLAIPVISAALGGVVYVIVFRKKKYGIFLGLTFSFAIAFRPQEVPFITLIFLYGFYHLGSKEKIKAIMSFIFFFLLWFLPFMRLVGGLGNYIHVSREFLEAGTISPISVENIRRWVFAIIQGFYFSFGISSISLFVLIFIKVKNITRKKIMVFVRKKHVHFYFIWITPSLLFNLLIRSEHAGYQGTYISAFLILISYSIWYLSKKNMITRCIMIACIVFFNLFIFFFNRDPALNKPYRQSSFHYWEIRKNDIRLYSKVTYIKKNFDPKTTMIITEPFQWRGIMYHLPEYLTYDIDGIFSSNERFKYIIRKSQYYSYSQEENKSFIFVIPNNITSVIFTDEDMFSSVNAEKKKKISLDGNSNITILSVKEGQKFKYSINNFSIISF